MWMESIITRARGNCNITVPNIAQFDLNNNDVDLYPITHQKIQNAMQRKCLFESKNQTSFKVQLTYPITDIIQTSVPTQFICSLQGNVMSDDHYIQIHPSGSCWPNNIIEQTEPIDLSCMKKTNSNAEKKARLQVQNRIENTS